MDRQAEGECTACTIVKQDTKHSVYPCTDVVAVTAVEDKEYYIDREPGEVLIVDTPRSL